MNHNDKTRDQLIQDLAQAYQRIAELEALARAGHHQQQALRHERYLLRTLIDNLPDLIYFKDLEHRFVVGNLAVARVMGADKPADIIGKTDFDCFPREMAERYYADEQQVFRTGQPLINSEEPVEDQKSGVQRWQTTTKVALYDRHGQIIGLVGIGRDITERKLMEQALRASREQVLDILESISDAFCAINRDWQFIYVNKKAEQLLLKTREQLLQKSLWTEFPEAISLRFYSEYHRAIEDQVTVEFEEFYPSINKWLSIHAYPYPDGLSIYFQDITERKKAEQEIKRYRTQLEELVDERTAELTAANDRLQREISRRKRAEVALMHYAERLKILQDIDRSILAAQSREAIAQAALRNIRRLVPCRMAHVAEFDFATQEATILATHLSNQVRTDLVRLPLRTFGISNEYTSWNTVRVVEDIRALPDPPLMIKRFLAEDLRSFIDVPLLAADEVIGVLTLASGRPAAFNSDHIAIAREVATQLALAFQQARLYEKVRRYAVDLEQRVTERTSALQEIASEMESFSYTVSHDLRAPLRAMQGFADALLEEYADRLDETGQDYSRRIAAAAQRMDNLIQDLLTYGRLSRARLQPQRVSLETVVAAALAQLEIELKERQAEVTLEEGLPDVLGHQVTLVQVVVNLLSNAIKFVAPGVLPRVCLRANTEAGRVRLWVEDNGIGVAPEHQERIFRIFERLHSFDTYPGTGIGLAFVHKGISRMGGSVGLESTPGQGSRFWLELPAARIQTPL